MISSEMINPTARNLAKVQAGLFCMAFIYGDSIGSLSSSFKALYFSGHLLSSGETEVRGSLASGDSFSHEH